MREVHRACGISFYTRGFGANKTARTIVCSLASIIRLHGWGVKVEKEEYERSIERSRFSFHSQQYYTYILYSDCPDWFVGLSRNISIFSPRFSDKEKRTLLAWKFWYATEYVKSARLFAVLDNHAMVFVSMNRWKRSERDAFMPFFESVEEMGGKYRGWYFNGNGKSESFTLGNIKGECH